jgi:hypothetical protein
MAANQRLGSSTRWRASPLITLTICISLIVLAALNAFFGQSSSDWVLPEDRELYFPPFLKSEGFYRSFLINLTFASIATAANGFQHVRYTQFLMWNDPLLAILFNLVLCIFAAVSLRSDSREVRGKGRIGWLVFLFLIGTALFIYSVSTALQSPKAESSAKPTTEQPIN